MQDMILRRIEECFSREDFDLEDMIYEMNKEFVDNIIFSFTDECKMVFKGFVECRFRIVAAKEGYVFLKNGYITLSEVTPATVDKLKEPILNIQLEFNDGIDDLVLLVPTQIKEPGESGSTTILWELQKVEVSEDNTVTISWPE